MSKKIEKKHSLLYYWLRVVGIIAAVVAASAAFVKMAFYIANRFGWDENNFMFGIWVLAFTLGVAYIVKQMNEAENGKK